MKWEKNFIIISRYHGLIDKQYHKKGKIAETTIFYSLDLVISKTINDQILMSQAIEKFKIDFKNILLKMR